MLLYNKARRDMGTVAKDFQNVQKALTSMEAKIDQKKAERHSILKQSKVIHLFIRVSREFIQHQFLFRWKI